MNLNRDPEEARRKRVSLGLPEKPSAPPPALVLRKPVSRFPGNYQSDFEGYGLHSLMGYYECWFRGKSTLRSWDAATPFYREERLPATTTATEYDDQSTEVVSSAALILKDN
jgi:hypothetical protein